MAGMALRVGKCISPLPKYAIAVRRDPLICVHRSLPSFNLEGGSEQRRALLLRRARSRIRRARTYLLTTWYLLHATCCWSLLAPYYSLIAASACYWSLLAACYLLLATCYMLHATCCWSLLATCYLLLVTACRLLHAASHYLLLATCYWSLLAVCYMRLVTTCCLLHTAGHYLLLACCEPESPQRSPPFPSS